MYVYQDYDQRLLEERVAQYRDQTRRYLAGQLSALLADALEGPVHALALHTYTPEEWEKRGGSVNASPQCRGGEKSV